MTNCLFVTKKKKKKKLFIEFYKFAAMKQHIEKKKQITGTVGGNNNHFREKGYVVYCVTQEHRPLNMYYLE